MSAERKLTRSDWIGAGLVGLFVFVILWILERLL